MIENKKYNLDLIEGFPDLERVEINGLRHYNVNGVNYPSVTTVLSANEEKERVLTNWRNRVGQEEADRISRHASYQGTVVHTLVEDHIYGRKIPSIKAAPHHHAHAKRLKLVADKHIDNVRVIEGRFYSEEYRTAGTIDLVAEFDGKLSIIDWKTSRKKKKVSWVEDYFTQESAYAKMFTEHTDLEITQLVTIMSSDTGDIQVFIESPENWIREFAKIRLKFYELYRT